MLAPAPEAAEGLTIGQSFGGLVSENARQCTLRAGVGFSQTVVCDKPAKATGVAREIKALQFSKMVLETSFSIAYLLNEFR
jgi:hypothetical protein